MNDYQTPTGGTASASDPNEAPMLECLAALAHEQWSGWMRYMFEKCDPVPVGRLEIPSWAVERWARQMRTPYVELTEAEKESDRAEARRVLDVLRDRLRYGADAYNEILRLRGMVDEARRERDAWRRGEHERIPTPDADPK